MKLNAWLLEIGSGLSPPSRGAWIEIPIQADLRQTCLSPPSRGAWIEIMVYGVYWTIYLVAPLAGGVD